MPYATPGRRPAELEERNVKKVIRKIKGLVRREEGLETVEYAIITGLIVAATIGVIAAIGAWVLGTFQDLQTGIGA